MPPRLGAALSTVFVTARSARCALTVAKELLLVVTGSNWLADAVAVFVTDAGLLTVAVMSSVAAAPFASEPTAQTPAA